LFYVTFVAVTTLALGAVAATGQERDIPAAISGLSGDIDRVLTGGYWETGDDTGFYRIVVASGGIEHISQRLFLQWMRNDYTTNGYMLMRTVEFTGTQDNRITNHSVVYDVVLDYPDDGNFEAIIDVYQRDQSFHRYVVTLAEDATYSITQ